MPKQPAVGISDKTAFVTRSMIATDDAGVAFCTNRNFDSADSTRYTGYWFDIARLLDRMVSVRGFRGIVVLEDVSPRAVITAREEGRGIEDGLAVGRDRKTTERSVRQLAEDGEVIAVNDANLAVDRVRGRRLVGDVQAMPIVGFELGDGRVFDRQIGQGRGARKKQHCRRECRMPGPDVHLKSSSSVEWHTINITNKGQSQGIQRVGHAKPQNV
jgi:hypothetical protein